MNYYRLPILVTTCFALFSTTPSYSQSHYPTLASSTNLTTAQMPDYESYIREGQRAIQEKLYQKALEQFQEALKLRPNDLYATKAAGKAKIAAYDEYMSFGYAASKTKDYQTALKNFQQALQLKPDDFYSSTAINNINQYLKLDNLAQNNISNKKSNKTTNGEVLQANNRFLWLGLGVTSATVLVFLFLFQKKLAPSTNISGERVKNYESARIESSDNSTNNAKANSSDRAASATIETRAQVIEPLPTVIPTEIPAGSKGVATSVEIDRLEKNRVTETVSNIPISTTPVTPLNQEQSKALTKLDVVTELVKELEHPSPAKRRKAIWELAQRADSRAMKPLVELMIEADSQERSLILEAVSQIASRTLKPMNKALAISLEDPNSQVRKNAIRDLTRVYDLMTQVSQRLSYSLDDPDNEVRETAKWALKQLNQLPSSVKLEDLGKEEA